MEPDWTLQTLVAELAGRGGKRCLLSVSAKAVQEVSAGDLAAQATAFAHGLREWGVRTGETVGLIAPNGPDWVVARLALGCLGAVVLAMDELSTAADLRQTLEGSSCRRILTSAVHVEAVRGIDPGFELVELAVNECTHRGCQGTKSLRPYCNGQAPPSKT
ncbi:MAG: AMP-binding protein [Methyloceanibacter sp.]